MVFNTTSEFPFTLGLPPIHKILDSGEVFSINVSSFKIYFLFLQSIKEIRCKDNPNEDYNPHAPGEDVVVMEEPAPRMPRNEMSKEELKRNGKPKPRQANGERLSWWFGPPDANQCPDVGTEQQHTSGSGNLMGVQLP